MKQYILPTVLVVLLYMMASSCDEPTLIGSEILPPEDGLTSFKSDTFSTIGYSLREDSIMTNLMSRNPLGSIDDPTFGRSSASIYAQLHLPTNDVDLGSGATLDSLVLNLVYAGHYGDERITHNVKVYRVIEEMFPDSTYYDYSTFEIEPTEIGSKSNFYYNEFDSLPVGDTKVPPSLRITLDPAFGHELIGQSGETAFSTDSAFLQYLNGIYIEADTSAGFAKSMMYLNLLSVNSKMTMYYHNDENDSLQFNFFMNNEVRTSRYTNSFDGSHTISDYIDNPDMVNGDDLLFAKGMSGYKAAIEIPGLKELKDVAINKAEIIFSIAEDPNGNQNVFPPPASAYLIRSDSATGNNDFFIESNTTGIYFSLLDQLEGLSHYGGEITTVTDEETGILKTVYKYNFTRHLQAIVNREFTSTPLYLLSFPFYRTADRLIVGGDDIDIAITYTLIE